MKSVGLLAAAMQLAMSAPAAAQAADGCTRYDAQTNAILPDLSKALGLMYAHDIPGATRLLPALEAQFAHVPAAFPAPQRCGAAVHVFDHHQYLRFTALQKAGASVPGYPAGTRFVEKELPFANLAYAVGWLRFEKMDFAGARAAYVRGLAIAPGHHNLTSELVATLLNQNAYAEAVRVIDGFFASDTDLERPERAKLVVAKALAQMQVGDRVGARASATRALSLSPDDPTAKLILERTQ